MRVGVVVLFLIILNGCTHKNNSDRDNELIPQKWEDSLQLTRHSSLYDFRYEVSEVQTTDLFENGGGISVKNLNDDTLEFSFLEPQWAGCHIEGNIELRGDTVLLLHPNICSPLTKEVVTEEVMFKFIYRVNPVVVKEKIIIKSEF